ncbi:MAG: hypothetical protein ACREHE_07050 [Rhizomicrobium sp.]
MSDVVKLDSWLGGNGPVAVGLATARDNHGNSISGVVMRCAGKSPQILNPLDWEHIIEPLKEGMFRFDGVVQMADGHPSPLQQFCKKGGMLSFLGL